MASQMTAPFTLRPSPPPSPLRTGERGLILLAFCLFLAGCGSGAPIATSGTQGIPREQLATIHVVKHSCIHEWKGQAVHIDRFSVGGVDYPLGGEERDFLVAPGEHTFRVEYTLCIHSFASIPAPEEGGIYAPPYGEFKMRVEPRANYLVVGEEKLTGANGVQTVHSLAPYTPPPKK
jgi:hypothetical protein